MLLLDINKFINENEVKYVTTANIMKVDKFDENGLFSTSIFGLQQSKKWRTTYGAIALNCQVMHPLLYEIAERRASIILKFFKGEVSLDDEEGALIKGSSGKWGIPYFISDTENVISAMRKANLLTDAGVSLCAYILKYKELAFIDNILVVPPQYRPVEIENNRVDMSPVNTFYINIINDANVVKFSDGGGSSRLVIYRIQNNVYKAYQSLQNMIKGKEGIQRKSLLGKIMDFSARAVITGDINIDPDHFGVPVSIALVLFKPFLIYEFTNKYKNQLESLGFRATQLSVGRLVDAVKDQSKDIPKEVHELFRKVLEEVIQGKVVLAKRDPALHRHSMRAVYITLVDDTSFHINPLVCDAYNADFDGDQMAIYLPMTEKAQKIAREKMLIGVDYSGSKGYGLSIALKKDTALGMYHLTKDFTGKPIKAIPVSNIDEAEKAIYDYADPGVPVIYNKKTTTAGRAIFEMCLTVPIDKQVNKKDVTKIMEKLALTMPSDELFRRAAKLIRYGCKAAAIVGKSIDITNYNLKPEFKKRRDEIFEDGHDISNKLDQLTKDLIKDFESNANSFVHDMIASGAESKLNNIQSSFVAKGYVANVDGEVIPTPVKTATGEGLNPSDYYQTSISGRSGLIDRTQKTQISGYLTRKLVYALCSVKLDPTISSIRTYKPFLIDVKDEKTAEKLLGRTLMNGSVIKDTKSLVGKTVGIVSALNWTSKELGPQCLPEGMYEKLHSSNIGIVAAQAIGERASQLTMQTFHMTSSKGFDNFLNADEDIEKVCVQDKEGNVISTVPIIIKVDREDITDMSSDEWVFRDFSIESGNLKIELNLDYDFTLLINDEKSIQTIGSSRIIPYPGNAIFGSMKNSAGTVTGAVAQIVKLSETRVVTNPEKLVYMLDGLLDGVPMWATEVLVSQLFRDPKSPNLPYRCGDHKEPPMRVGLKSVALYENWRRGAAFENVSKALHTAILTDNTQTTSQSDLDAIVSI